MKRLFAALALAACLPMVLPVQVLACPVRVRVRHHRGRRKPLVALVVPVITFVPTYSATYSQPPPLPVQPPPQPAPQPAPQPVPKPAPQPVPPAAGGEGDPVVRALQEELARLKAELEECRKQLPQPKEQPAPKEQPKPKAEVKPQALGLAALRPEDLGEIQDRVLKGNMPKGGPPLSAEAKLAVAGWVSSGQPPTREVLAVLNNACAKCHTAGQLKKTDFALFGGQK